MPQEFRKNILIICEGTNTEPNYFDNLRDLVLEEGLNYYIKIRPIPESERIIDRSALPASRRQGRRSRQIINVPVTEQPIPEEYAAQPLRYVWQAQQGLIDGTYDEVWAVFDLDGHPRVQEAFALAEQDINGKKVRVAFSSIAFETWILLHFECNDLAFDRSQCRTGDELHDCGQGTHMDDCNGENCITGYLKVNNYIDRTIDIKKIRFNELNELVAVALKNAALLRSRLTENSILYDVNPITTADRLVFKLLYAKYDFQWTDSHLITIHGLNVFINRMENILTITLTNATDTAFILLPTHLSLFDSRGEFVAIGIRELIRPGQSSQSQIFDFSTLDNFDPIYLGFEIKDGVQGITELLL